MSSDGSRALCSLPPSVLNPLQAVPHLKFPLNSTCHVLSFRAKILHKVGHGWWENSVLGEGGGDRPGCLRHAVLGQHSSWMPEEGMKWRERHPWESEPRETRLLCT